MDIFENFQTFDVILSEEMSCSNVLRMFENLQMSSLSDEEQVSYFYTVMRNHMIVGCIDDLLNMYMHSGFVHKAICHILDGWSDVKNSLSAINFRMYATPLLVKKIRNAINKCIINFTSIM